MIGDDDYFAQSDKGVFGRERRKPWRLYPRFPKQTHHGFYIRDPHELSGWFLLAVIAIPHTMHPVDAFKHVFPARKRRSKP